LSIIICPPRCLTSLQLLRPPRVFILIFSVVLLSITAMWRHRFLLTYELAHKNVQTVEEPKFLPLLLDDILHVSSLNLRWDDEDGEPVSDEVLLTVWILLLKLRAKSVFFDPGVSIGHGGSVDIVWMREKSCLSCSISPNPIQVSVSSYPDANEVTDDIVTFLAKEIPQIPEVDPVTVEEFSRTYASVRFPHLKLWDFAVVRMLWERRFPSLNIVCASAASLCLHFEASSLNDIKEFKSLLSRDALKDELYYPKFSLDFSQPTFTLHRRPILDICNTTLQSQLSDSYWSVFHPSTLACLATSLRVDEIRSGKYGAVHLGQFLFLNTNFQPTNFDGEVISNPDALVHPRDYSLDWESYGWTANSLATVCEGNHELHIKLLCAHYGKTLCRKLAFDPIWIDLNTPQLF